MRRAERGVSKVRLVLGLAVLAVGLVLTLDTLDLLRASDILIFWPLVLIAIGMTRLGSRAGTDIAFSAIFIGLGLWFLAWNLGWVDLWPGDYFLPAILLLLGSFLVLGGLRRRAAADDPGSYVSAFAFWSGIERASASPSFRGADLTAIMGGVDLDLRRAKIAGDRAEINVFTLWGGIDLRLPKEWNVDYGLLPIMGGYSDETEQTPTPSSPTLVIRGAAIMAGLEIKN